MRQLRKAKDLSQRSIDRALGTAARPDLGIESGWFVPTLTTLAMMATALDVPLYTLFVGKELQPASYRVKGRTKRPHGRETEIRDPSLRECLRLLDRMS